MASTTPEYSIWLMPGPAHGGLLQDIVARLSALWCGVRFLPHVTIQGDITALPPPALEDLLARLAARTHVQHWHVTGAESTDHFFRCLFLRFGNAPAFATLQAAARDATATPAGLSPFPHLSLAYGDAGPAVEVQRAALAAQFAGHAVSFDRLVLCHSSQSLPIADWQVTAEFPLLVS